MKRTMLLGPAVVILVWYAVTSLELVRPLFLPTPVAVLAALYSLGQTASFWADVGVTVLRISLSFVLSCAIGMPLGLVLGYYRGWYRASEFIIDFLRSLPVLAIFPLMLLLFGIGEGSKVATAVLGGALVIMVSGIYGVLNGRRLRRATAQIFGATRWELFTRVITPDALPELFAGLRIALSFVVFVIIVTEMFVSSGHGVGARIFATQLTYRVPELYAWILVAGTLGYLLNKIMQVLDRRIVHWRGE